MDFAHYSQRAVDLVNADLSSEAALHEHLSGRPWLVGRLAAADLVPLRIVQLELAGLVDASAAGEGAETVRQLNELLGRHPIRPRVSGHDESSWHLHVNDEDAPVAETVISEALLGLTILVTELGATRLGRCAAQTCNNAFVDTSANSSRRFCSTRCSTRTNVAALRRRKQAQLDRDGAEQLDGVSAEQLDRDGAEQPDGVRAEHLELERASRQQLNQA